METNPNPKLVFAILLERARMDKELALHIEAAQWQATAMTLAQEQEADQVSEEEKEDVPADS